MVCVLGDQEEAAKLSAYSKQQLFRAPATDNLAGHPIWGGYSALAQSNAKRGGRKNRRFY
jgi:hypothetical protein